MPRLRIPVLLKDADSERIEAFLPTETRTVEVESLLPGPVSDRVAIVDLRPGGTLAPPLPVPTDLRPRRPTATPYQDAFTIRWSVFATVLETLKLFESPDCLGRRVEWAFPGPQLLVVPEAGLAANAYYQRETRSLQFFSHPRPAGGLAHTAASHDVVAHETAHAVLDGIAPWLYDASSPQSLAIHESVADLTALFAAVGSRTLASRALALTDGDLTDTRLFSSIARELRSTPDAHGLRSLVDPPGPPLSLRDAGSPALPALPHHLSVVLSRAFHALLLDVYEARRPSVAPRPSSRARELHLADLPTPPSSTAEDRFLALWFAGALVKRLLFRGLDYLPPGDVAFVDLARAVLACDRAAHPRDDTGVRALLVERLRERGIGDDGAALDTPFDGLAAPLLPADLDALVASDWHAMRFVEARRDRLGVPPGVPFDVLPRLVTRKQLRRSAGAVVRREVVLKVAWKEQEPASVPAPLPPRRWVRKGATVVFDQDTGAVCATVELRGSDAAERDAFAAALSARHALAPRPSAGPGDPGGPVAWRLAEGAFELQGAGRTLHAHGGLE
jgi:hypothetical protein